MSMKMNNKIHTFITEDHKKTDKLNEILETFLEKWEPSLDWRDSQEIEIHLENEDVKVPTQKQTDGLVKLLNENGFPVISLDWRYEQTIRINFKEQYFGSFGLEDYTKEDFDEFLDTYPEIKKLVK